MALNTKIILSLSRDTFKILRVDTKKQTAETIFESPFTTSDLETLVSSNKKYFNKPFRILLDDSISYILIINDLPINSTEERNLIAQKVKDQIPDLLDNNDWDYKETDRTKESKTVTVFAPIKEYSDLIRSAVSSQKLSVEAMEPVSIASLRHQNPVVGLALKTDLYGPDEKVLNIAIVSSRPKRKISPLIIILFVIIITFLIFVIKLKTPNIKPVVISPPTPTSIPSVIPTLTSAPFDRLSVKMEILNGSGTAGLAKKFADQFNTLGYQNIKTGNAENSNYTKTIVKILSKDFHEQYLIDFKEILKIGDSSITVDNTITSDVIVILGKN